MKLMRHSLWSLLLLSACAVPPAPPLAEPYVEPPAPPVLERPAFNPPPQARVEARTTNSRIRPLTGGHAWLHEFSASGHEWQIILFDSHHYRLRVIDQPDSWAGGGAIDDTLHAAGAIAGVNGGFFSPDFTPLGLMITNGRKTGSWQANKLLTGSIAVSGMTPHLYWNAESRGDSSATHFLQAGPRLVDASRPIPNLERTKNVPRTFIATDGGHLWALGIVRSTSLGELSNLLATTDLIPGFHIQRSLNLDGGRSTAIHAQFSDGQSITEPGWSTVRNYLGIVPAH